MSGAPAERPPARKRLTGKQRVIILLTLIPPLLVLVLCPLGLDRRQSGILAALILVILWWVTGAVERTLASGLLLAVFLLFSGAPWETVFTFPLSENFVMIVAAFLFSQGISNSGLAEKLIQPILGRVAGTLPRLLLSMVVCAVAMIFIIPQPFSRIIILAGIYSSYLDSLPCVKAQEKLKPVLMAALFIISVFVNMLLLQGDIVLNGALLSMGQVSISEGAWLRYMFMPTAVFLLLAILLFCLVFRKELKSYSGARTAGEAEPVRSRLSVHEKRYVVLILAVVIFWAAESLHGISGTVTAIVGVVLMACVGLLRLRDWHAINIKLLVFLTAAFSIGGVLKACGVADVLFSQFMPLFPDHFSVGYAAIVLLASVLLHMVLGSNITTMSVVVPGLMMIGSGVAPQEPLLLLIFVGVCGHFLLPFHHVTLLLGEGKGYYSTGHLIRYGVPLTALVAFSALVLYMGWWNLLGMV